MTNEFIKVKDGVATRESVPDFLVSADADGNYDPASLADLSWTDPSLGLRGCAWWPLDDQTKVLAPAGEKYDGEETLVPDPQRKVVVRKRNIVPWSASEVASYKQDLQDKVDNAVADACARKQRFAIEYMRREAQARAYVDQCDRDKAAGKALSPPPPLINGFAKASGLDGLAAARLTVVQADALYARLDVLANLRMRKYEIASAATALAAKTVFDNILLGVRAEAIQIA